MVETQYEKNESGLMGIFKILWKRRRLIILGTMAVTVLAVAIVFLVPKTYRSKAVVSLSDLKKSEPNDMPKSIDIPTFRRFSDTFQNRALFMRFLKKKGYNGVWDFDKWEFEEQFFRYHYNPIYAFETEERGVKVIENSIMGIIIIGIGDSPQNAMNQTQILGSYLLTTILNMQVGGYIENISIKSQAAIVQVEKAIINLERETNYLREKTSLIENQLLKLPGAGPQATRELVTADANSERYLSPQQQLVSVKMGIMENQIQIDRLRKNAKVDQFMLDYIEKIKPLVSIEPEYLVNDGLLTALIAEKNKFFAGKTDNESKLASHTLAGQFFYFQKLHSMVYKFISGPTHPEKHFLPKRKRIVLGAFFLSLLIFSFLAFVLEVSKGNKKNADETFPTVGSPTA